MTVTALPALIDKQDSFELVRTRIADILAVNFAAQAALATADGRDPDLFNARVFEEASNPFSEFQAAPTGDQLPLVNVMFDSANFDMAGSDIVERQKVIGTYNIDCYGYAASKADGTGHLPGDREASFVVQRCLRFVRNILMAAENTYLQFPRGSNQIVWQRWPQSVNMFQPALDGRPVQHVVACRMAFDVTFNEWSPQVSGDTLEYIATDIFRASTGELLLEADYDYT